MHAQRFTYFTYAAYAYWRSERGAGEAWAEAF
jgi:hypothetical protein